MTLAETYLKDEIRQSHLFDDLEAEIKDILYNYGFEKLVFVDPGDTGELKIGIQEAFPSQLIRDLDEYMGFQCSIDKTQYHIELTYKIEDDDNGQIHKRRKTNIR